MPATRSVPKENTRPLKKVSVSYSPAQDRLLFAAELGDQTIVHLWITRRLLALLAPHVERWLKEHPPAKPSSTDTDVASAEGSAKPKPVAKKPLPADADMLVTHIDVTSSSSHLALIFRGGERGVSRYALQLQSNQLAPWWKGIHQTCELGGWSLAWPVTTENVSALQTAVTLH